MKNLLKRLLVFISILVSVFISLICISACDDEDTSDVGITYFSGSSADESVVYTLESAYWNKQWSSNGQTNTPNWYLLIRIKIVNNTPDNYIPNNKHFTVYYQIPETEVDVRYYLYEMLPIGNGGYSSSSINYIKPGQTAYLSLSGNFLYENPTHTYTKNFYLLHKLQTEIGVESKIFNLGVLKED